MAVLTVVPISRAGVNLTTGDQAAAVGGDSFANTGKELLYVDNQHGSAQVVTLVIPKTVDGQAVTARTVSVPAGERMLIGPFPVADYNDTTNNRVSVTYSGVTALTVMALQLTNV